MNPLRKIVMKIITVTYNLLKLLWMTLFNRALSFIRPTLNIVVPALVVLTPILSVISALYLAKMYIPYKLIFHKYLGGLVFSVVIVTGGFIGIRLGILVSNLYTKFCKENK